MTYGRDDRPIVRGCSDQTPRDRAHLRVYGALTFLWAVAYVGTSLLIASDSLEADLLGRAVALLPSFLALLAALAFLRYLKGADELQRRIQLEALTLAVVAGFVLWPALRLLDALGAAVDLGIDIVPMAMIAAYVFGVAHGQRQYR